MEYVTLGTTDLRVSRIAFGGWPAGGYGWGSVDDNESVQAMRRALELGINVFDTADVYGLGHSEETIARALGSRRHDVVIVTKFGMTIDEQRRSGRDASPSYIVRALEASLRRLQVDCIPVYLIHWPDPKTPLADTMEALARCREEGKIRHIGCSNFSVAQIADLLKFGRVEMVQAQYSLLHREIEQDLIPFCQQHQIGLFTFGSLAQGLLSGKYSKDAKFAVDDHRAKHPDFIGERYVDNLQRVDRVSEVAARYHASCSQAAINWVLGNPHVAGAIVGMKRPSQVDEIVGAASIAISPEARKTLGFSAATDGGSQAARPRQL